MGIPYPRPMAVMGEERAMAANTQIDPGEQTLTVALTVSFELE